MRHSGDGVNAAWRIGNPDHGSAAKRGLQERVGPFEIDNEGGFGVRRGVSARRWVAAPSSGCTCTIYSDGAMR